MAVEIVDYNALHEVNPSLTIDQGTPLPEYEFGVEKRIEHIGFHALEGVGSIQVDRFNMSDGTSYDVHIFQPRKVTHDTAITYTTPLLTGLDGFNAEPGKELAEQGMVTFGVSSQNVNLKKAAENFIQSVFTECGPDHSIVSHDAFAQLVILDTLDLDGRTEKGKILNFGYSRGSQEGLVMQGYAKLFGRIILLGDYRDPCGDKEIGPKDIDLKDVPLDSLHEVWELAQAIKESSWKQRLHMLKTLPRTPSSLLQQVNQCIGLMHGEVGTLTGHIPRSQLMIGTMYDHSKLNGDLSWEEKFKDYPRVHIGREYGWHSTGVRPAQRRAMITRISRFQNLAKSGVDPNSIMPEDILLPPVA